MLITIKCLYINMQDIANNNRLINTAENLPHPKRPFKQTSNCNFTRDSTSYIYIHMLFFEANS